MDADTLRRCHRAAAEALWGVVPVGVLDHVVGNALTPLALGDTTPLATCFAEVLRELPRSGLREPGPELSDEQIERAARRASVAVEAVLSESVGAVEDESNGAVGLDSDGDHEVEIVGVHGDHGAHEGGGGESCK